MAGVQYINSSGRELWLIARSQQGRRCAAGRDSIVARVFKIIGFDRFFEDYPR